MFFPAVHAAVLVVLLSFPFASAVRAPIVRQKRPVLEKRSGASKVSVFAAASSDDNGLDLSTVHDLIYMANFTVGDIDYAVQLDTGSSDVWIKGDNKSLPQVKDTTLPLNLTYGVGWVFGNIAYGSVQFAGINVSSQALLDVSSANNPALAYGAEGLVGLGFTSLSSIDNAINKTGASTGRSLLYNLFIQNPTEPNFIAFSLQRSTDSSDTVEGTFAIGEVDPPYKAVLDGTAIPTWPVIGPNRWTVLLEALLTTTATIIPNTTVAGAPGNRAVVLLDSGTSYTYASTEICKAIYGGISGAVFSEDLGQWVVPCDAEVDIALQIDGQVFPIHPLDVTPQSLTNTSECVGSFVPQSVSVGAGEFDIILGDNVLRNIYSVYDFGDFDSANKMGNPYVKLLALTNPDEASKDFHAARGGAAATNITYNAANSSASSPSSVSISADVNDTLNKIVTFLPAMLGIMALNAVVLIALIIFGVVFMCRKSKAKATTRKVRGRSTPLQVDPRSSYIAGEGSQPHAYQPVSMAITEDLDGMRPMSLNPRDSFAAGVPLADRNPVSMALTEDDVFVPPSPKARTFKSSGLRPIDRPDSAAYQRQPSIAAEDHLFVPPSPGFRSFDGKPDRPKSASYQRQTSEDSLAHSFDERPKSVGYQRSPLEDDSVFVTSPTDVASAPMILPPPPQRQAPPPPSRQVPQAPQRAPPELPLTTSSPEPQRRSSQISNFSGRLSDDQFVPRTSSPGPIPQARESSPQPHRQSSRESAFSVRLTDEQFAPSPNSGPGPIPRPRQASNNSSLFVAREFTGRPGDRPQSFAPADPSVLLPPSPAFHSGGGRPKSMA